ncbi:MAG TPA: hypothetical protein VKB95_10925 [Chitinophagaceae bacterium]|nr:hypothetical protein [Chitinophagaceae bacterium]
MEVHAHSHLASGETHSARKKWTHYFWEFLIVLRCYVLWNCRGVASIQYFNNGFQPVAKTEK